MTQPLTHLCTDDLCSASFFAAFESNSNSCNVESHASQFAETFLAAGPHGSQTVRRTDFLAALPRRHQMFAALGSLGASLIALRETPLGSLHLLATTEWRIETARVEPFLDAPPIKVTSTFLLERHAESWRILVYLAHHDLAALLRARWPSNPLPASDCPPSESKVD